jgi:uncharacterized protein YbbK (DUF523 family)/uncharacterized protein YbgA (DUF1722 family)
MRTTTRFPRPTVVVSRCLCGARCRWDGDSSPSSFVRELKQYARVIPACPELEIGLGVPRDRIILVRRSKSVELYQSSSGMRLAQKMHTFTRRFLRECGEIDGFILKHKSPSCGLRGVKLYSSTDPDAAFTRKGVGLFAAEAMRLYPHAAFADDDRLDDPGFREHFLTRLYVLTGWRAARKSGRATALGRFHEYHRILLGAYQRQLAREMDQVSGARQMPTSAEMDQYESLLLRILQKPARRTSQARPFELAREHYSQFLSATDRRIFQQQLQEHLDGVRPISDVRKTVQVWAVRYDKNFIRRHSFFRPYPGPLADA